MEFRQLGKSGLRVPPLAFGTATFGGGNDFYRAWGNAFAFGAVRCTIGIIPGDFAQIAKGWANRSELDVWRAGFSFAIILDGAFLQSGFGPALHLFTQPNGRIVAI